MNGVVPSFYGRIEVSRMSTKFDKTMGIKEFLIRIPYDAGIFCIEDRIILCLYFDTRIIGNYKSMNVLPKESKWKIHSGIH